MSRRGFTLIELLVVISIIAVLAALLLPAIGLIRFTAIGNTCMGNQRQIAIGILSYGNEWEGNIPWHPGLSTAYGYYQGKQRNEANSGYSCGRSVFGAIYPYTETMAMARCPADRKGPTSAGADDPNWGGHTPADCPGPETCRGRSFAYAASNGVVLTPTSGCQVNRYKAKMQTGWVGGISIFTGADAAGVKSTNWGWSSYWGSTVVAEMWYDNHRSGKKLGLALASIDGSARWRTYAEVAAPATQLPQLHRYEEP